jgi:hypothetical protein
MNACTPILVFAFTLSACELSATTLDAPNGLLRLEVNDENPERPNESRSKIRAFG